MMVLELARTFGLDASLVEPMSTAQARQDAPRPLRSGLRYEAVAAVVGREPATLAAGIEGLRAEPAFRSDFPELSTGS